MIMPDDFHVQRIQYDDSSTVSYPDIMSGVFVDCTDILIGLSHQRDGTESSVAAVIVTDSSLERTEP